MESQVNDFILRTEWTMEKQKMFARLLTTDNWQFHWKLTPLTHLKQINVNDNNYYVLCMIRYCALPLSIFHSMEKGTIRLNGDRWLITVTPSQSAQKTKWKWLFSAMFTASLSTANSHFTKMINRLYFLLMMSSL